VILQDRKTIKGEQYDGYFLTIDDINKLVRDFQADCFDGFVSHDESYIQKWLDDRKFNQCGLPNGKLYYCETPKYPKNKEKTVNEYIIEIISEIENSDYIDPAEHIYDGIKRISRHLNDTEENLMTYVNDFHQALSSSVNIDVDGTIKNCIKKIDVLIEKYY